MMKNTLKTEEDRRRLLMKWSWLAFGLGPAVSAYLLVKLIIAIIKPARLDAVREALIDCGIEGMTATEVSGFGRQRGHTEIYRGAEYAISFVPKTKVEVAVPDGRADAAIEAIRSAANTENIGDGKIFVLDLGQAVRIRTGESGDDAL